MSQYIDRREAQKSYRPVAGSMSPGLQRAREPYRIKNALLGLALGAFAVGVWAYSISAVKQDIFDDVDEEARVLSAPPAAATASVAPAAGTMNRSGDAEQRQLAAKSSASSSAALMARAATPSDLLVLEEVEKARPAAPPARGILQHLDHRFPRLLDPQRKTLVWGAPPVDDVGKMSKSS
ncbi:hypothetical protein BJ912DRAFT_840732 [Pholiota molesta]|nr:hypothetical protein BJ912DRAFT_840732 [Pholiota molesta]